MKLKLAIGLALAGAVCWALPAGAQERLFVDITEGEAAPLAIGVPDTPSGVPLDPAQGGDAGAALAGILRADLGTIPFFRVVPAPAAAASDDKGLLAAYSAGGTQALVIGRASRAENGSLDYACSFYDVFSGIVEVSRTFRVEAREWRRAAHQCADMVVAHATGYPGHFDTRFALVAPPAGAQGSGRQVVAVDVDGANPVILAGHSALVAMPQLSPDNRSVLFMAYEDEVPGLVVADLATGRRTRLQLPPGLPSAARFSPDGRHLALALSRDGNTDIHEYELATGRAVRLTDATGIDTSPTYSPDGSEIAFESDRSGQPQLYVMRRDGSNQRRISFGDPHASPAWSPDGALIAFASRTAQGSQIGVMAPDGGKRRILTRGAHDESPAWAASGRAIAFQRNPADGGTPELHIADRTGRRPFRVSLPLPGSEPHWSEVLP
jgi:TolB protein